MKFQTLRRKRKDHWPIHRLVSKQRSNWPVFSMTRPLRKIYSRRKQSFSVLYGSMRVNRSSISKDVFTRFHPTVHWNAKPHTLYTLLMWDPDAHPPWLHWLVQNLERPSQLDDPKNCVVEYTKPTPPHGTHRYVFRLYEQADRIDLQPIQRNAFSIRDVEETYSLHPIAERCMCVSA